MRYPLHSSFFAPARARSELWRTAAALIMTFVLGVVFFQIASVAYVSFFGADVSAPTPSGEDYRISAVMTLVLFVSLGLFGVGLIISARLLNKRGFFSLIGSPTRAVRDFLRVAGAVLLLFLVLQIFLPQDISYERNPNMPGILWAVMLPISCLALLIQVGTEELIFRGYLQQQLAARFPRFPLWMILPSLLFGLAHLAPGTDSAMQTLYILWAFAFGLAAADLTARSGTLGAAVGFHFANNFFAVLVTAVAGGGSELALYFAPLDFDDPRLASMMLPEFGTMLCAWLAARVALKL